MKLVQTPPSAKTSKYPGKPAVIAKKRTRGDKLVEKNSAPAIVTDEDVRGARNCLLHGVRATGVGLGVLMIEDEHFSDMVEHDEDYRAMILEMVKVMQVQKGYDAMCAALAEKALEKMTKALVAFGDFSKLQTLQGHPRPQSPTRGLPPRPLMAPSRALSMTRCTSPKSWPPGSGFHLQL